MNPFSTLERDALRQCAPASGLVEMELRFAVAVLCVLLVTKGLRAGG